MTQHIGIVAGSAEGAALCYRTICLEAPAFMGEHNHPEITMNSVPLAEHMRYIRADDWEGLAEALLASARKVAEAAISSASASQSPARTWRMCRASGTEFMVISGWLCSPMTDGASRQIVR